MSDPTDEKTETSETPAPKPEDNSQDEVARIEALIESRLKPIKEKLDQAYAQRDAAQEKADKLEKERRDAELKRLEEEGKHKEVYEARLEDERKAREALERRNIELTRDLELKDALKDLTFRNERASQMAFQEIVGDLSRDEKGNWVHKSGLGLRDAVKKFAEDEANSFLFKSKGSSGSGSDTTKPADTSTKPKSIFEMSQAEVLKMAAEGKLR